jgi:CysZ protein
MLVRALLGGLVLFLCGFLPLVGQTIVPVAAAFFGGWMLTVELTSRAFDWRGIPLRERRRMLGANRAGALGFGLATYLVFLVPLGAVVAMPAALAGATMLARSVLPSTGKETPLPGNDDSHPR